ncbi:MAG: arsenic resistance protein [Clostridia bacterium]|nr:arsenic resistance protein [Clostridia bacterium]
MMWSILSSIKEHLSISILVSMLSGLFIGYYFETKALSIFILPLTVLMVFPMMVNIDFKKLVQKGDRKILWISQLVNFIGIPLIAFLVGTIFLKNQPYLFIGFMLMAVLPTSGMTIAWTGFTKGNINAALKITILGLFLSAVLAPFLLKLFFGTGVEIPVLRIIVQILSVILVPLILGLITKRVMIKHMGPKIYEARWAKRFPLFSSIGVVLTVFIATSLKAKAVIDHPQMLLTIVVPVVIFYTVSFAFTTIIGLYFCKEHNRTALVYGTVMRNLSIALAIAVTAFDKGNASIALIVAVSYIFQVQFAALYIRFYNKLIKRQVCE